MQSVRIQIALRATRLGHGLRVILLLLLLYPVGALAQLIEVRSASVESADDVLLLNAQLLLQLPDGARQAIREGVELHFNLDIRVRRARRLWFDDEIARLEQRYELFYHAVSARYLVRNLNSDQQQSYSTLEAAMESLQQVERLPILDQSLVRPDERHEISVRAGLDVQTMPDALRFVLFWTDDWQQQSEWYTWPLRL